MQEAITILKHSESVLMKRIKAMKDGKPKYAASERLKKIRQAISILRVHDEMDEIFGENEDDILIEKFTKHPPNAKA
jgi:hypothetical protein